MDIQSRVNDKRGVGQPCLQIHIHRYQFQYNRQQLEYIYICLCKISTRVRSKPLNHHSQYYIKKKLYGRKGRRGRDHMVVGFTTTCATSAYHH